MTLTPHILGTSLRIVPGRTASHLVHGGRYGVGLSVKVGLGLLGLYLWWGKPWLVTSRSPPGLVVLPKAPRMARLSVVASLRAIFPSPPSRFVHWHHSASLPGTLLLTPPAGTLLLLTSYHPTAQWLPSPLYPLRSTRSSTVTPSGGIALPAWLPPTPWLKDVITGATMVYDYGVGPHSSGFTLARDHYPLPQARVSRP